eukprot:g48763.t1
MDGLALYGKRPMNRVEQKAVLDLLKKGGFMSNQTRLVLKLAGFLLEAKFLLFLSKEFIKAEYELSTK